LRPMEWPEGWGAATGPGACELGAHLLSHPHQHRPRNLRRQESSREGEFFTSFWYISSHANSKLQAE
jgi:hypothetical protein